MVNKKNKSGASQSTLEVREARCGESEERTVSSDLTPTWETRLATMELRVAAVKGMVEDAEERLEALEGNGETLRDEFQVTLNESLDNVYKRNEALEAAVEALRREVEELKGELSMLKRATVGGLVLTPPAQRVEVPKPKVFKGTRSAKEVDNFLWGIEQYFKAVGITEDATKVSTAAMYLVDTALLWWRRRNEDARRGGVAVNTWELFQREFKEQFYPMYAEDEARSRLRQLRQRGGIREYVRDFSELMLQISGLSERDALFWFLDGLKPWAKTELKRRGVEDLSRVIAVAESLVELGGAASPRPRDKATSGGEDSHESDSEGETGSSSDSEGEARRPKDRKAKSRGDANGQGAKGRTRSKGKPMGCFLCDGPHRARECPTRKKLASIIRAEGESEREEPKVSRLGSIQLRQREEDRLLGEARRQGEEPRVMTLGAIWLTTEEGTSRSEKTQAKEEHNEGTQVAAECHTSKVEIEATSTRKRGRARDRRRREERRRRQELENSSRGSDAVAESVAKREERPKDRKARVQRGRCRLRHVSREAQREGLALLATRALLD